MKIALCRDHCTGPRLRVTKDALEKLGHKVYPPEEAEKKSIEQALTSNAEDKSMSKQLRNIMKAEALLVLNTPKKTFKVPTLLQLHYAKSNGKRLYFFHTPTGYNSKGLTILEGDVLQLQ